MSVPFENLKDIWIEGNIGAGKSTLGGLLALKTGYMLLEEPVDRNPYLKDFYEALKSGTCASSRIAITMQFFLLGNRYIDHISSRIASIRHGTISDRSLPGDTVFATCMLQDGHIDDRDYKSYMQLFRAMSLMVGKPDVMIYLRTDPEISYQRTNSRKREVEKEVPLAYFQKLHQHYEALIDMLRGNYTILELDWNIPWHIDDVVATLKELDQTVKKPYLHVDLAKGAHNLETLYAANYGFLKR